jgi:hypothetical protein
MKRNQKDKTSLKAYLEDNITLLTVFGLFNSLMIFSISLIDHIALSMILSFLFMSMSVIVLIEILKYLDFKKPSITLLAFNLALTLTTLFIIAYWIYGFKGIWLHMPFITLPIITIVSLALASVIVFKFGTKIIDYLVTIEIRIIRVLVGLGLLGMVFLL